MTHSRRSTAAPLSLATARAIAEEAKKLGLLKGPNERDPIRKDGQPVAATGSFRAQWMDITPAMAEEWLKANVRNRSVSADVVAAYARDMANGDWTLTHQGIAFNDRDELIDGQHRLHAIVASGKTIRSVVTFGLPSVIEGSLATTMDAVDRGRTRSVGDQLKIQHGIANGSYIAALCVSIGSLCFHARTRRLSVGQTLEIYEAFRDAIDWMAEHRTKQPGIKARGVAVAFAFAIAGAKDPEKIKTMWEYLQTGEGAYLGGPIGKLGEFLASDDARLLTRGHDRGLAELALQAIFLELRGHRVATLELSEDGADYFRSLQRERVKRVAALFAIKKEGVA